MEVNSIGTTNDYLLRQKVGMLVNEISCLKSNSPDSGVVIIFL